METVMRFLPVIRRPTAVCWRRTVATWSPLASAFNSIRPQSAVDDCRGLFGIPELRSHDGFYVLLVSIVSLSAEKCSIQWNAWQRLLDNSTTNQLAVSQVVYGHFGPKTLRTHWCRSVLETLRHHCRNVLDTSAPLILFMMRNRTIVVIIIYL